MSTSLALQTPWALVAWVLLVLLLLCAAAFWLGSLWARQRLPAVGGSDLAAADHTRRDGLSPGPPAQAAGTQAGLDAARVLLGQQLQSRNLRRLVQCWPEPALLLQRTGSSGRQLLEAAAQQAGWQVLACSPSTLARWPQLQVPGPLPVDGATDDNQPLLPLPTLLDAAALGATIDPVPGWRLAVSSQSAALDSTKLDDEVEPGLASTASAVLLYETAALAAAPDPAAVDAGAAAAAAQEAESARSQADSFSFTVSHDLRAPVRVVEGFTRIVKEDYGPHLDRVANDHLDRVLSAAARMNHMIDALLTLARLSTQPLVRQPFDLSQTAHYVVDELRSTQPQREVEVQIDGDLIAHGDPTLLRLVLENLLGNAWKYSAKNPRAVISLRSVAHEQGRAYEVRDNGAGFDMRSADRLFGLFQRLHSASEFAGHGVGLASVRRIVQRHGGHIWAESQAGKGAAFFFTLKP